MDLLFDLKPQIIISPITNKSTVAESESIEANHLRFTKFLFQHYSFNFYVNKRIAYLLGTSVNTELAKKTFYHELIQNTSLQTNYNFASIITEINKKIEYHTQQRYPITYANKGKEKLQTLAVTPQQIQPPTWKKHKIESPTNPSYYYTSGSTINITSIGMFTSNTTSIFEHFLFQSKQRKEDLLGPYDFGTTSPWENLIPENSNIETPNFQTQPNPNLENPEIETPNFQTQHNQNDYNLDINNQQHLPPVIVINPVPPIAEQQQQLLQPPQQPQQLLQQPQQQLQQPNVNPMAYAPIAKLEKFTSKEDNAQVWLNDMEKAIIANSWNNARAMQAIPYFLQDTANSWYQSLVNKPQEFAAFKLAFLQYFNNNNSINQLANTFTIIKQGKNEAVTIYLGHFYRNLYQIQAIQADYLEAYAVVSSNAYVQCIQQTFKLQLPMPEILKQLNSKLTMPKPLI
ncbi:hypothetical protein G9A89_005159 [Geosiphon pyriformis]|nr:hypothetical protein G9A89_005159 [Geosiphon pyriformis]